MRQALHDREQDLEQANQKSAEMKKGLSARTEELASLRKERGTSRNALVQQVHSAERATWEARLLRALLERYVPKSEYVPMDERVATAQMMQLVDSLNYEISQAAISLADTYLDVIPALPENGIQAVDMARNMLAGHAELGVISLIDEAPGGLELDIVMEVAFQACMTYQAYSHITRLAQCSRSKAQQT